MSIIPGKQKNVAEVIVESLVTAGVTTVWGVVGDALNPVTDAIRREERLEWIGVRHEEVAAFAASAQAQLTGKLAVCMGTVGPGAIHLLNGLYDAKKAHAPVLAITGQVPTEHIGTQFFQEVDNDKLFADVALMAHTITNEAQVPALIAEAVNTAYGQRGVTVLTLPGDIGDLPVSSEEPARFAPRAAAGPAAESQIAEALAVLNDSSQKVALLVGRGAVGARDGVLETARRLRAPMVLTLKGKTGFEGDNEFQVGQTGLIGNPGAVKALEGCDVLFMIGTDFPYTDWYPKGKTVIQLDSHQEMIGRRVSVAHAIVGDAAATLSVLSARITSRTDSELLDHARSTFLSWKEGQNRLANPSHDSKVLGKIRAVFDNPEARIRPESVAAALDRHAPSDAIFTSDTGMSTVWLSRFIEMTGTRDLVGSYNLGSMANAMPMALGAQALDRSRAVVAMCGDGGLMMLLGDLRTAVTYKLPVVFVVFNNGRLGMVKLEQEQGGLPEFGTELDNPDFGALGTAMGIQSRRIEDPSQVDAAIAQAFVDRANGPVLLDFVTNPEEVSVPGKVKIQQGWGFAIAKSKEILESR
jgi:pyruvate dehydrogenase (quinone)